MFRTKPDKDEADRFFKSFASTNGFAHFVSLFESMAGHELEELQELAIASLTSEEARKAALVLSGRYQFLRDFLVYLHNIKRSVQQ